VAEPAIALELVLFVHEIVYVVWELIVSGAEPIADREGPVVNVFQTAPFLFIVQLFTFETFQEIVVAPPAPVVDTRSGEAAMMTFGASTVTLAFATALLPIPIQVIW